jgi:hypothetical protein
MTALNNDAKIVPLNPTIERHYNRFDHAKSRVYGSLGHLLTPSVLFQAVHPLLNLLVDN